MSIQAPWDHDGKKRFCRLTPLLLVSVLSIAIFSGEVYGQIPTAPPPGGATGRPGVIQYAESGEIAISVNVWGDVRVPGRYVIPRETDLIELLTVAGGPGIGTRDARMDRSVFINISRNTAQGRSVIFESTVHEIANEGLPYPALQEGDIVAVETHTRERFGWRDTAALVGAAATVILLVERIIFLSR